MNARTYARNGVRFFVAIALFSGAACSSEAEEDDPDDVDLSCEDEGVAARGLPFASEDTYDAFIKAEQANTVMVDAGRLPVVTLFPEGRMVSASTPPTFVLNFPKATTSASRAPRPRAGFWARLRGALQWERRAHAATCPPVNGEVLFMRLTYERIPTRPAYKAVVTLPSTTAERRYVPDYDTWQPLMMNRHGQMLMLTMMRAKFQNGAIVEGPFVQPEAARLRFTVVP
jgi:hypothetical protein